MAGFAILFEPDSTPQAREEDFQSLLNLTARFKLLELPGAVTVGRNCTGAKLDAPVSIHPGIVRDEITGSWLLATGTVVSLVSKNPSDTSLDALLRDYIENGIEALERYDGHFGLVFYNGQEESLSVVSDPMGCFAVYYAQRGHQIFVSTSALAVARQVGSKPDTLLMECFLRTGKPHGERTLWQDVKRMRPATVLNISRDRIEEFEYWSLTYDEGVARLPLNAAVELAEDIIFRTFKRAISREGKIWADMTGGFDTRLVTMFMAKMGIPFVAYCVGPEDHPDVQVSRLICQEMGWEFQHMPLPEDWEMEQISWFETALFKGDGHLNVLQTAGVLKGQQQRALMHPVHTAGGGGDEWRYHNYGAKILFPNVSSKVDYDDILDSRILSCIPIAAMRQNRTAEVRIELREHLARLASNYLGFDNATQTDIIFRRHRHPIHGGAYLSAESGIMRALMPFCFKELENFGFSLNHYWRIKYHSKFVRNLIEDGNPALARIRTASGWPAMPIRITNLHRFGPLWVFLADNSVGKISMKFLGRRLSLTARRNYPQYPLPVWRGAGLRWAAAEKLLAPEKMLSGGLYNAPMLDEIVAQSLAGNHQTGEFLDRVITVEMALRGTRSGLD